MKMNEIQTSLASALLMSTIVQHLNSEYLPWVDTTLTIGFFLSVIIPKIFARMAKKKNPYEEINEKITKNSI